MKKVFLLYPASAILTWVADESQSVLNQHCIILYKFTIDNLAEIIGFLSCNIKLSLLKLINFQIRLSKFCYILLYLLEICLAYPLQSLWIKFILK